MRKLIKLTCMSKLFARSPPRIPLGQESREGRASQGLRCTNPQPCERKERNEQRNEQNMLFGCREKWRETGKAPKRMDGGERENKTREVETGVEEVSEESGERSGEGRVVIESKSGDSVLRSFGYGVQRRVGSEGPWSRRGCKSGGPFKDM